VTSAELAREVISLVESRVLIKPSPAEFEMAYQARLAVEKIRFAIKQLDSCGVKAIPLCEVSLPLLDALDRLEAAERNFQWRWRHSYCDLVQMVQACRESKPFIDRISDTRGS
jgi:hypothetical protein